MLNDLKFVQGAVARKDYVPALTHFHIADGHISGFNGILAISTPTDLAVKASPKAAQFVKAVERVPDGQEIVLNLTEAGRLSIKAGPFRAYVECHEDAEQYVRIEPEGVYADMPPGLLQVLKKVAPFMGEDATRPWARGVLLRGQSAFATNNIVLVEHWLPIVFPNEIIIPAEAVKEMIRVGIDPSGVQMSDRSVTFHYPNGSWIRSALIHGEWPDLARVLNVEHSAIPLPDEFFEAVRRLDAFTTKENHLFLRSGMISTSASEGDGALMELDGFDGVGCHFLPQIVKLDGIVEQIDFSTWPRPCLFFGELLRGAIIGPQIG